MIQFDIHIRWGPWKLPALLLACLASVLILSAAAFAARHSPAAAQEATTAYFPSGSGRHYYLTNFSVAANQAATACTAGYHMASLWEISGTSNLKYDTNHPDAFVKADSGHGPPANWYGWIRTGYDSSTSTTAGTGNCSSWTSSTGSGTIARLKINWLTPLGSVEPWDTNGFSCTGNAPVWCAGDFNITYLPLVRR